MSQREADSIQDNTVTEADVEASIAKYGRDIYHDFDINDPTFNEHFHDILKLCDASAADSGGFREFPAKTTLSLYLAKNGVPLTVGNIEAVAVKGMHVHARTTGFEHAAHGRGDALPVEPVKRLRERHQSEHAQVSGQFLGAHPHPPRIGRAPSGGLVEHALVRVDPDHLGADTAADLAYIETGHWT